MFPPFCVLGVTSSISSPVTCKLHFGGHIRKSSFDGSARGRPPRTRLREHRRGPARRRPHPTTSCSTATRTWSSGACRLGVDIRGGREDAHRARPAPTRRARAARSDAPRSCGSSSTRSSGPIADGEQPPADLLDEAARRRAQTRCRRAPGAGSAPRPHGAMRWTWPPPRELADPLRPITHAAVELLTSGPLEPPEDLRQLPLALPRPEPQPQPALVLDGGVRHADEAAPLRGAPPGDSSGGRRLTVQVAR